MLIGLLCAALAVILLWPDTEIGKTFRRVLVEWPARKLAGISKRRLILGIAALVFLACALVLARMFEDGIVAFQFVPEGFVWIAAFDAGTYLDLIAAVWLVAGLVRLRAAQQAIKAAAARARQWSLRRLQPLLVRMRRPGADRAHRLPTRPKPPKQRDDEDRAAPGLVFA